jgi:hypothetical protein
LIPRSACKNVKTALKINNQLGVLLPWFARLFNMPRFKKESETGVSHYRFCLYKLKRKYPSSLSCKLHSKWFVSLLNYSSSLDLLSPFLQEILKTLRVYICKIWYFCNWTIKWTLVKKSSPNIHTTGQHSTTEGLAIFTKLIKWFKRFKWVYVRSAANLRKL